MKVKAGPIPMPHRDERSSEGDFASFADIGRYARSQRDGISRHAATHPLFDLILANQHRRYSRGEQAEQKKGNQIPDHAQQIGPEKTVFSEEQQESSLPHHLPKSRTPFLCPT